MCVGKGLEPIVNSLKACSYALNASSIINRIRQWKPKLEPNLACKFFFFLGLQRAVTSKRLDRFFSDLHPFFLVLSCLFSMYTDLYLFMSKFLDNFFYPIRL